MNTKTIAAILAVSSTVSMVTGCAGVQPVAYSDLAASSQLKRNSDDDARKVPYRYAAPVVWSQYSQVVVEPVVVYRGADNQFGKLSDADKVALADYMNKTFVEKLGKRFEIASHAAPGTLRVKLILTGAETTTPVIGQAMHFDIAGNVYNSVQAIRGGPAAFGGSVSFAVEVYDGASDRLLKAYVSKQYPNAMNLPAAFGSLNAAKTGLDKGADALADQLR
jgi:hypothetical protein